MTADDAVRCAYRSYDGQCQRRRAVGALCRQHAKIVDAKLAMWAKMKREKR